LNIINNIHPPVYMGIIIFSNHKGGAICIFREIQKPWGIKSYTTNFSSKTL
jgi:hypothetical protein